MKPKEVVPVTDLKDAFADSLRVAVQSRKLDISTWAQDYVANMLAIFVRSANLFEHSLTEKGSVEHHLPPIAISYLETQSPEDLRRLGDRCLFLTGFLYDFIRCDGMPQVRYYGDIGSSAYLDFARSLKKHRDAKPLYYELAQKFWDLSEVIQGLRTAESYSRKELSDTLFKYTQEQDPRHADILFKCGFVMSKTEEDN